MRHGPSVAATRAAWRRARPGASAPSHGPARAAIQAHGRQPSVSPPGLDWQAALDRVDAWVRPLLPDQAAPGGTPGEALLGRVQQLVERARGLGAQIDAVFAFSPDGLVLFDGQGRVLRVNPAFCRLTGLSAEMLVGLEEAVFLFRLQARCDGDGLSEGLDALAQRLAADGPAGGERAARGRVTLSLRPPRVATLQVGLFEADASAGHRVLQLRDITTESQVDQMKSEFLAAAAHELRTPMTSICGFVELLLARELPPPRQRDLLERVQRQSGVMVGVVNDLLDLARIEAGRGLDFDFEDLDLAELVPIWVGDAAVPAGRDAVQVLRADGDGGHASAAAGGLRARVDRRKLHQALGNLIANAYRYSPEGGPVSVTLARRVDAQGHGWVALAVRDLGIGLSPEALQRVGERFFRDDRSGRTPGTGLGVSIVRQIAECHAGRLTVDSVEGQGSCFTLLLPALT